MMSSQRQNPPQDGSAAAASLLGAAVAGEGRAQFELAALYQEGLDVPRDLVRARGWYETALANGEQAAKDALAQLGQILSPNPPQAPPSTAVRSVSDPGFNPLTQGAGDEAAARASREPPPTKRESLPAAPSPTPPQKSTASLPQADSECLYLENRILGFRAMESGRLDEAIELFGEAIRLRPDRCEAHLNMGRAFQLANKVEAARQAFLAAQRLDDRAPDVIAALSALPKPPSGRKDFQVGEVVSGNVGRLRYRITDVKKGGFGAVYIVEDEQGERHALKTFQAQFLWSDDDRDRFIREALTWARLEPHPNIVTLKYITQVEAFPCLVLEYVSGGDLRGLVRQGPLPLKQALELALQFCDGMAFAHGSLGIVHRDIKPDNCLVTERGVLKITDFGLARAFEQSRMEALGLGGTGVAARAQYTTTAGTPPFMAPEQFKSGATLDTRTDVYAFGIMLYNMLTGDLPTLGIYALRHMENAPERMAGMPSELGRLMRRCVSPDPAQRPSGFEEVRAEIAGIYENQTGMAAPPPRTAGSPMSAAGLANRGVSLASLGRLDDAAGYYDRALAMDPRCAGAWMNKGTALSGKGLHLDAIACYDRALELAPALRAPEGLRVTLRRMAADWWAGFNRPANTGWSWFNPSFSPEPKHELGPAPRHMDRHMESIVCAEGSSALDARGKAAAWRAKGQTLRLLGWRAESLDCYEHALMIQPDDGIGWALMGAALLELGKHKEAMTCFDKASALDPRDSEIWFAKGGVSKSLGENLAALQYIEQGLIIDPRSPAGWSLKGRALHGMGRYADAVVSFNRSLEIAPLDSDLWLDKGRSLWREGSRQEALVCYERSLEIRPQNRVGLMWRLIAFDNFGSAMLAISGAIGIVGKFTQPFFNSLPENLVFAFLVLLVGPASLAFVRALPWGILVSRKRSASDTTTQMSAQAIFGLPRPAETPVLSEPPMPEPSLPPETPTPEARIPLSRIRRDSRLRAQLRSGRIATLEARLRLMDPGSGSVPMGKLVSILKTRRRLQERLRNYRLALLSDRRRNTRVLFADDAHADLCQDLVESLGFQAIIARSGAEAVSLAKTTKPDIIFINLDIPGIRGDEACRMIRSSPESRTVPLVLFYASPQSLALCAQTRVADRYLPLPFAPEEISETIDSLLHPEGRS